jgi:hypothetical protein
LVGVGVKVRRRLDLFADGKEFEEFEEEEEEEEEEECKALII